MNPQKRNIKTTAGTILLIFLASANCQSIKAQSLPFRIVDTDQQTCYNNINQISPPSAGELFYGQDANYSGHPPSYQVNGDGTVTDMVTGLMWQQHVFGSKLTFNEAVAGADTFSLAGYADWRLPAVKELYSLILFSGTDPSGPDPVNLTPFIDTNIFEFRYGDTLNGERIIDAQYVSSTEYVGTTMGGDHTVFGVNFADGRIKGYPTGPKPGQTGNKQFEVKYVRGNTSYGINNFTELGDGTIRDYATGLIWDKNDSGEGLNWEETLSWVAAKNNELHLGHDDWRLPDAKELQSIIDYTRSLQTANSPAIDPIFNTTAITDEGGGLNYPFYWTGTTHVSSNGMGNFAVYLCFGEALGWMEVPPGSGNYTLMDVHGAGAQRSDPKEGDPSLYPLGHGPQGDAVRIFNFVRLVRTDSTVGINETGTQERYMKLTPNPVTDVVKISLGGSFAGPRKVSIYNGFGELVVQKEVDIPSDVKCEVWDLPDGIYIVVASDCSALLKGKFIKR